MFQDIPIHSATWHIEATHAQDALNRYRHFQQSAASRDSEVMARYYQKRKAAKSPFLAHKPCPTQNTFLTHALQMEEGNGGGIAQQADEIGQPLVMVLPIQGVMLAHGGMSSYGTIDYINFFKQAQANEQIVATVLDVDSGGGQGSYIQELSHLIRDAQKPVFASVQYAYSAAYYTSAYSDGIYLRSGSSGVGSVGTMASLLDYSVADEKAGIKEIDVYADTSPDKNKSHRDFKKGNYQTYKIEVLNPLDNMFNQDVIEARGGKIDLSKENVTTGRIYFGQTAAGKPSAIEVGLADGILSIEEVIQLAYNEGMK